jgi:hypothetical protein
MADAPHDAGPATRWCVRPGTLPSVSMRYIAATFLIPGPATLRRHVVWLGHVREIDVPFGTDRGLEKGQSAR